MGEQLGQPSNEQALVSYCREMLPLVVREVGGEGANKATLPFGGYYDIDSVAIHLRDKKERGFEHKVGVDVDGLAYLPETRRGLGVDDYQGLLTVRAGVDKAGRSDLVVEVPVGGGARVVEDVAMAAELINTIGWWQQNHHNWRHFGRAIQVAPTVDNRLASINMGELDKETRGVLKWYKQHFGLLDVLGVTPLLERISAETGHPVQFSIVKRENDFLDLLATDGGVLMYYGFLVLPFLDAVARSAYQVVNWQNEGSVRWSKTMEYRQMDQRLEEVVAMGKKCLCGENKLRRSLLGLRMEVKVSEGDKDMVAVETNMLPVGVVMLGGRWRQLSSENQGRVSMGYEVGPVGGVSMWPFAFRDERVLAKKREEVRQMILSERSSWAKKKLMEKLTIGFDGDSVS